MSFSCLICIDCHVPSFPKAKIDPFRLSNLAQASLKVENNIKQLRPHLKVEYRDIYGYLVLQQYQILSFIIHPFLSPLDNASFLAPVIYHV